MSGFDRSIKILDPSGIAFFGETSIFRNQNGGYDLFLSESSYGRYPLPPNNPLTLKTNRELYKVIAKWARAEDLAKLNPVLMEGVLPLLSEKQIAKLMASKLIAANELS